MKREINLSELQGFRSYSLIGYVSRFEWLETGELARLFRDILK
jgi:hypothetical protein